MLLINSTLSGDGSTANVLKIAQQGATAGQALTWNGTTWLPATAATTYVGHFIITATGNQSITGLPFTPSQINFQADANINALDLDVDNCVGNNNNTFVNSFGSMTGYVRGTGTQQVIYIGGSGSSINDISRYASSTHCIGIRYSNNNGDKLGLTSASFVSYDADGFTINVDNRTDDLVVLFTAYK